MKLLPEADARVADRLPLMSLLVATFCVAMTASPALAQSDPTTASTMPAQPLESSSGDAVTMLSANCLGCTAGWGLWETGNTIRALRASHTDELVSYIHVHWAFIMPEPDSCANMYEGDYASNGAIDKWNWSSDISKDSTYGQGGQHTWSNIGAHKWTDDGVTWVAGYTGSTDICKDFGF